MADVIECVYQKGCIFDAWSEHFHYDKWLEALEECGLDLDFYTTRTRQPDELFPWDFLDCGVTKQFLLREWKLAQEEAESPNCREKCLGCGAARYKVGVCMEEKTGIDAGCMGR